MLDHGEPLTRFQQIYCFCSCQKKVLAMDQRFYYWITTCSKDSRFHNDPWSNKLKLRWDEPHRHVWLQLKRMKSLVCSRKLSFDKPFRNLQRRLSFCSFLEIGFGEMQPSVTVLGLASLVNQGTVLSRRLFSRYHLQFNFRNCNRFIPISKVFLGLP